MRREMRFRFGGPITPVVKKLMIINGAVFLLQLLVGFFAPGRIEYFFGLHHIGLLHQFMLWQPLTYMFLHGNLLHIFFNLFALWMFAGELELRWGSKTFLQYYIFSGVGAGIFIAIMNYVIFLNYNATPITIGASGALYAILLAYGLTWPNREVLLYFLFPIKMKYLVIIFGAIEFFGTISSAQGAGGNISHIGHLGGLISGFIYIMYKIRVSPVSQKKSGKGEGAVGEYLKKSRLKKKQEDIETRIQAKMIIDRLLEKIAREGMSSLTPKEKKELEWARRHYYPDDSTTIH
jgi:membrane associated rhomboid family serine protease